MVFSSPWEVNIQQPRQGREDQSPFPPCLLITVKKRHLGFGSSARFRQTRGGQDRQGGRVRLWGKSGMNELLFSDHMCWRQIDTSLCSRKHTLCR